MKRVTYVILGAVIVGIGAISLWLYVKYFRTADQALLVLPVTQATITESVKVRGKVAAENDYDLSFSDTGTISKIYVSKGQAVKVGDPLVAISLADRQSEVRSLAAVLAGKKSSLDKLLAGASKEDITVATTKVDNAATAAEEAEQSLKDTLSEAFTVSDNAVRNYADSMIEDVESGNPRLKFMVSNSALENAAENGRVAAEGILAELNKVTADLSGTNLSSQVGTISADLQKIRDFLNNLAAAVNTAETSSNVMQTQIDTWKSNVSTARTALNTAIADVAADDTAWRAAISALTLSKSELDLKQAASRGEDVSVAESDIAKAESDLETAKVKLARATLYAPASGLVKKVWLKKGEVATPGESAVSLASSGFKAEAEISELDIVKIKPGQTATIYLDAFPSRTFAGKVVSIDPDEIDKDGDTYYNVNFSIDQVPEDIRPGMSNDIRVDVETKENVTAASNLAIYRKEAKTYVKVKRSSKIEEIEVKTGISDGQNVEILSGLSVGDQTVISAD